MALIAKGEIAMEEFGFILHETFSSQSEEQRKKQLQNEFGQYIADLLLRVPAQTAYDLLWKERHAIL